MAQKVNLDIAQKLNITCRRGDTFSLDVTLSDSSGDALTLISSQYQFIMHVRTNAFADGADGLVLSTVLGQPPIDNQELFIGNIAEMNYLTETNITNSGVISIKIPYTTMIKVPSGRYVYDLQYIITSPTSEAVTHTTILTGSFIVNEDVTEFTTE